ncbi:molybdopterin-guanine dinucleotide biosynthesis protein B [Undibacterium sp. Jales W-56]|uniref:molybdopterin-guanine dinucleotide biosynthesis protein B n=1 Tax=Undibacterium sp. Jales W-56 TaxID=2897325 RepID=UPI0021CF20EC|nr:molybdopterin-guanine dinucleotide biosynthesis protein B [Undibacterium sp. Jales W-56]MCU6435750.1 molybdopterin-guanine dinucleotide biosynthesis protein B [Undibacterium sp. Jales W-56]
MSHHLLGIVGWSGSGKTTLLEYLIAELSGSGLTVNVVKHSHHDIILEPSHKDSARFRRAGANEVLLASPFRYAITSELREQEEPGLLALLPRLAPADLTLIEGYKWEAISKIEIRRPSLGKPALYPHDQYIVAVASDAARPDDLRTDLAWLDLNRPEQVLAWIQSSLAKNLFLFDPKVEPTSCR